MKSLILTGYGLSVSVNNSRLVFKRGINDPFGKEKSSVLELPASACDFDKVIIQGKGFISTEALERLAESNINVVMLDKPGKLFSYFHRIGRHKPLIRQRQYDSFSDETKLDYLRNGLYQKRFNHKFNCSRNWWRIRSGSITHTTRSGRLAATKIPR